VPTVLTDPTDKLSILQFDGSEAVADVPMLKDSVTVDPTEILVCAFILFK
jgi:hypothetical protein